MGVMGLSYLVVGVAGPQLGLEVAFVPMLGICAVLSIIGGFMVRIAKSSLNKYYKSVNSGCVIR